LVGWFQNYSSTVNQRLSLFWVGNVLGIQQGTTNTLALAILYIYLLCPHTVNTKTIHSNLNSLNTFTKETGSPNVKLVLIR
jgi:hypothetical protein